MTRRAHPQSHPPHPCRYPTHDVVYLALLGEGEAAPGGAPGTREAESWLWRFKGTLLALRDGNGAAFEANNGNVEPHRGFGHVAFNVDDVYAYCEALEAKGVRFQKKPDEGRMKGLAFALDPDGYWVEIVARNGTDFKEPANFSQVMMRVKDATKALKLYTDGLDMTLVAAKHFAEHKFSLYFLCSLDAEEKKALGDAHDPAGEEGWKAMKKLWKPVLELTHNHGTEDDAAFSYHTGNTDPVGFAHVAFAADDVPALASKLEADGWAVAAGELGADTRVVKDTDGYSVQLVPRDHKDE